MRSAPIPLATRRHTIVASALGFLSSLATFGAGFVVRPLGALLVGLRLIQGLALGGEYGGAATVVAEHAPPQRRGFATSWIQITPTAGLPALPGAFPSSPPACCCGYRCGCVCSWRNRRPSIS